MTILITAYMMNYLLSSGKGCVQVLVMTKEIEKMKTMILNDMDAGVTLLDGKTGFLKMCIRDRTKGVYSPRKKGEVL